MKHLMCLLMMMIIGISCCACGVKEADKPAGEYDELVTDAVEVLKEHWTNEIYLPDENYKEGDGYLQIVNTRVIEVKDEPVLNCDTDIFEGVDYVVEFVLFANCYYTAPFYFNSYNQNSHVVVYEDGTMKVGGDIFDIYRGRSFSSDFTGIIEEIVDMGSKYNGTYILK